VKQVAEPHFISGCTVGEFHRQFHRSLYALAVHRVNHVARMQSRQRRYTIRRFTCNLCSLIPSKCDDDSERVSFIPVLGWLVPLVAAPHSVAVLPL